MAYEDQDPSDEVKELGISTAKKGFIYVGGEIGTSVIVLVLLIFLTRVLQPAAFGLYSIAISFAGFLGIASNFGMGTAFRKMLPGLRSGEIERARRIVSNGYYISLSVGIVIAVAGFLLSGVISNSIYHNPTLAVALEIAALVEFVSVAFNLTQAALVGFGLVKEATIANTLYSIFYLAGSVILVLLGFGVAGAVSGMLIGLVVGAAVGLFYAFRKARFLFTGIDKRAAKEITAFSAPVVASNIAVQGASSLSVLLLGAFAASQVVGNYSSAFRLGRFVELTVTSINFILLATFSSALSKKSVSEKMESIYNNSIYYTSLFMLPLVAFGIALSEPIVKLLFSSSYTTAPLFFSIIIAGMAVGMIGTYASSLIIGNGDTRRFMRYQVFAVAMQIALLVVLTPLYKALGVIVALFVVTPIVLDIIYIMALKEQFKIRHRMGGVARIAVSSVAAGVILFAISYAMGQRVYAIPVDIVVALAIFPPLLCATMAVGRKNIDFIGNVGKRLGPLHLITDVFVNYSKMFLRGGA